MWSGLRSQNLDLEVKLWGDVSKMRGKRIFCDQCNKRKRKIKVPFFKINLPHFSKTQSRSHFLFFRRWLAFIRSSSGARFWWSRLLWSWWYFSKWRDALSKSWDSFSILRWGVFKIAIKTFIDRRKLLIATLTFSPSFLVDFSLLVERPFHWSIC